MARTFRQCRDREAAKSLAIANLRFVLKVAHEFSGYGLDLSDLVQEGNIGLLVAISKFDPERGYRLITYAVWWIRAFIWVYVMRSRSLVRLPSSTAQRKLFFKLRSARHTVEQRIGGAASKELLASELGVGIAEVEGASAAHDVSIDADFHDKVCQQPAMEATQEHELGDREMSALRQHWIGRAMNQLNERERETIRSRYFEDEPVTLATIGKRYSVSRERVRQVQAQAFGKIRARLQAAPSELREAV